MPELTIIGDVHGKIDAYWKLMQKLKPEYSIQVGDFGFKKQHEWFLANIDYNKHKINFGNHDDYTYLNSPHSTGNYQYFEQWDLMTIRGAKSIDTWHRTEGKDWWREEEMTYLEWQKVIDAFEKHKPKHVVSHDCPQVVRQEFFAIDESSITSRGLRACFDLHHPHYWFFGHHHRDIEFRLDGTLFRCLDELKFVQI